ncbi:MAG: homoserine kinase, partial [Actinomycetota bacterium]|nr:homoserine kinase [Actinomycetota bacterium]
MDAVTIRVPASAANLGPGYDAFGLALGLYNTFSAQPAEEWHVDVRGEGAGRLATDGHNRVAQAMKRAFREIGPDAPRAARITCDNRIPTARGLGSSAAAIVGGLVLADAMCGSPLGRDRLLELAVELEGHPDNVAAALLGGFTIGWSDEDGPAATSLQPAA